MNTHRLFGKEDELLLIASRWTELGKEIPEKDFVEIIEKINDWTFFLQRAFETNLAPLVLARFDRLRPGLLPLEVMKALKSYRHRILMHNLHLYRELEQIGLLFDQEGIDFIPLKGMMLAEVVYKNPGLRQISDMDLLVRVEKIEDCKNLLVRSGWDCKEILGMNRKGEDLFLVAHPYLLSKGKVNIELHQHIHNGHAGYKVPIEHYWNRAKAFPFLKSKAMFLAPEDLLQHLALHLYKHLENGQMKACSYYDIALVMDHYRHSLCWITLKGNSLNYGCWTQVHTILLLVHKFWGAHIPDDYLTGFETRRFSILEDRFAQRFCDPYNIRNNHLKNGSIAQLVRLESNRQRWEWFWRNLFPSSQFIVRRYKVSAGWKAYLYYPYHWAGGMGQLSQLIWRWLIEFAKKR